MARAECLDLMQNFSHASASIEARIEYARCINEIYPQDGSFSWVVCALWLWVGAVVALDTFGGRTS